MQAVHCGVCNMHPHLREIFRIKVKVSPLVTVAICHHGHCVRREFFVNRVLTIDLQLVMDLLLLVTSLRAALSLSLHSLCSGIEMFRSSKL